MHVVCDIHMRRRETCADSNQGTVAEENSTIRDIQGKHMEKGSVKKMSGHCINHPGRFERPEKKRRLVMCAMLTRGSTKRMQIYNRNLTLSLSAFFSA